jgi:hypothetical protein
MPAPSEGTTYETIPGYPGNTFLAGAALVAVGLVGTLVTGHVQVLLAVAYVCRRQVKSQCAW